jgi:aminoglycoside 2'-N-acetyltransferase I
MPTVHVTTTEQLTGVELRALRAFLDDAFDGDFSDDDWAHACGGWHVIVPDGGLVLAHAAVVARRLDAGGRRWRAGYVEAVAAAPSRRRSGLGSEVMRTIGDLVVAHFELGALSTDVHAFYERHGWERWRGPSFVDDGTTRIRTADEDDGIMVLRHGPSAGLSLDEAITCAARPGDDW